MAEVPVADCALAGPRFIARNPVTIAIWTGLQVIINLTSALAMLSLIGPKLTAMTKLSQSGAAKNDPQAVMQAMAGLMPGYLVLLLISVVVYAIIYGVMNRAVLRPQDSRFAYLRLGADELRQGMLVLIYVLLGLFAYLGVVMVGAVLVGILSIAGSPIISGLGTLVVFLGALSLFVFLGVRLSLSSALTFDTGRLNVFGGWTLSRGHFWSMLSVYLLCAVQMVLATIIGGVVMWLALMVLTPGGDVIGFFTRPDVGDVGSFFSPARIVYTILAALLSALLLPIGLMPGAAMYRALATGRTVGEVFA